MRNYLYLLSVLFILSLSKTNAQDAYLDSLENALKNAKNDEDRYFTMASIAGELTFSDPQQAIVYAREVKAYYKKTKNYAYLTKIINNLGISYAISGEFDKSEKEFTEWLKIGEQLKDSINIAQASVSLGNIFHNKSDFNKAEAYYLRAMHIFEKEDSKKGMSTVYTNLGNVYKAKGNYKKALDLFIKALKVAESYEQSKGTALTNIGDVFADMGNQDKAIEYFKKAIEVFTEEGKPYYIAWGNSNLASVYFDKKEFEKAEELYKVAGKMHEEQNDPEGIAMTSKAIGNIRFEQKKYAEAKELFTKAAEIYQELKLDYEYGKTLCDLGILEMRMKNYPAAESYLNEAYGLVDFFAYDHELSVLYNALSEVNKYQGDFKKALDFKEKAEIVKDSIFKGELTKSFAEKEAKYQNETKQKENEILRQKNKISELHAQQSDEKSKRAQERSQMLILFAVFGALLLGVIILILVRSNRMKLRTNFILKGQNQEIRDQKEIIEIKNKDITDSINYAQKIQQALLPDDQTLKSALGDSFILFFPRDIVSGDFYWIHKVEGGDVFFAVADCTGHGVPGAFMSMMGIDMLNKIVIDYKVNDPGKILTELNNEVKNALAKNTTAESMNDGMDIIIGRLNASRTEVNYAAAMRSIYFINKNNITEFKGNKTPIGGNTEKGYNFESKTVKVNSGDCIYLTSDGYVDQFGGSEGKKYMNKNLKELFLKYQHEPMSLQLKMLGDNFHNWRDGYEQIDDVTILGIKI